MNDEPADDIFMFVVLNNLKEIIVFKYVRGHNRCDDLVSARMGLIQEALKDFNSDTSTVDFEEFKAIII